MDRGWVARGAALAVSVVPRAAQADGGRPGGCSEQQRTNPNVPSDDGDGDPIPILTTCEQAVASLLGRGVPDEEIAHRPGLTPPAIAAIVERIGLRFLGA